MATWHSGARGAKAKRATGAPRSRGRPTKYCLELAEQICDRLADGTPINRICRAPGMPTRHTVKRWEHRYPDFCSMIMRGREFGADALAEQVLDIADAATPDTLAAARLRFNTIRWLVSKIAPRRYGGPAEGSDWHVEPLESIRLERLPPIPAIGRI